MICLSIKKYQNMGAVANSPVFIFYHMMNPHNPGRSYCSYTPAIWLDTSLVIKYISSRKQINNEMKSGRTYRLNTLWVIVSIVSLFPGYGLYAQEDQPGRIVFDDPRKAKEDSLYTESEFKPKVNAWGLDLMVSDGGVGFGIFYERQFTDIMTGFFQTSFSEAKDPHEFEQYTYYGDTYAPFKVNRIFRVPIFFGMEYRLFGDEIADNFRPYINAGAGPVFIYTTPASDEFFKSFSHGHPYYTYGGFIGVGSHFGFDRTAVLGINFRYYIIPLPTGIQSDIWNTRPNANGFFITLNFGAAY